MKKIAFMSFRPSANSSVRAMLVAVPIMVPVLLSPRASATGGWVPERWLDSGGKSLKDSPEFYWDIELKRLAKENSEKNLPFKLKLTPPQAAGDDGETEEKTPKAGDKAASEPSSTEKSDIADFEDALKSGRLKPANPEIALKSHKEMRATIERGDAPAPAVPEIDSEFADYHKAVNLFYGKKIPEAQAAWEKLLQRPAEQRHYRSVWAAFMLGKTCLQNPETRKEAIGWFEKCRQFARDGFADTEALAADSYGWQARAEYDTGDRGASARHYLQQLALGDESAVNSLKLLVPDRDLNGDLTTPSFAAFPPKEDADPNASEPQKTEAQIKAATDKATKQLMADATDPILRQIITAHVLATTGSSEGTDQSRLHTWLEIVGKAKLDHVEGAASLGWAAYMEGDYAAAAKWTKLEKSPTPLGQWLQAKLALRNGDFAAAAAIMKTVLPGLPDDAATRYDEGYLPKASAAADLGASLLAQGKFSESFAAFWNSGCWADAAYVAENLLPTDELVQFVKANAILKAEERTAKSHDGDDEVAALHREMKDKLMSLTGRRLIREDRNAEGRALLDPEAAKLFDQFHELGTRGNDEKVPKKERAKALFDAAVILEDGSSWCGTEDDVIRAEWGGYAPENPGELVKSRLIGRMKAEDATEDDEGKNKKPVKTAPIFLTSTPDERKRLGQIHAAPMKEYVRQASALAVRAATLLPDNTEETADVLNQAGRWIQDLDNPGADKIYSQLEKRCKNTAIGKAAIKKHWFIVPEGPWTGQSDPGTPAEDSRDSNEPALPDKK